MDKEKRKRRKYYNKVRAIPVNWSQHMEGNFLGTEILMVVKQTVKMCIV